MSSPSRPPRGALALALLVLAALALTSTESVAQEPIERGLAASADATIRVYNLTGSTSITGWDRDSVAVLAELAPGAGRLYMGGHEAIKVGVEPLSTGSTRGPARLIGDGSKTGAHFLVARRHFG